MIEGGQPLPQFNRNGHCNGHTPDRRRGTIR
jgi:hypothetical protein